MAGSIEGMSF